VRMVVRVVVTVVVCVIDGAGSHVDSLKLELYHLLRAASTSAGCTMFSAALFDQVLRV